MSADRKGLDLTKLSLTPAPARRAGATPPAAPAPKPPADVEGQGGWPSREAAPREVQLNMRVPEDLKIRFTEIAYQLRLSQAKTLERLVELFEETQDER